MMSIEVGTERRLCMQIYGEPDSPIETGLREALEERKSSLNWELFLPSFEYTTDNGAMIAISGYYQYQKQNFADLSVVAAARKPLEA